MSPPETCIACGDRLRSRGNRATGALATPSKSPAGGRGSPDCGLRAPTSCFDGLSMRSFRDVRSHLAAEEQSQDGPPAFAGVTRWGGRDRATNAMSPRRRPGPSLRCCRDRESRHRTPGSRPSPNRRTSRTAPATPHPDRKAAYGTPRSCGGAVQRLNSPPQRENRPCATMSTTAPSPMATTKCTRPPAPIYRNRKTAPISATSPIAVRRSPSRARR
jgi:hypothetical protein